MHSRRMEELLGQDLLEVVPPAFGGLLAVIDQLPVFVIKRMTKNFSKNFSILEEFLYLSLTMRRLHEAIDVTFAFTYIELLVELVIASSFCNSCSLLHATSGIVILLPVILVLVSKKSMVEAFLLADFRLDFVCPQPYFLVVLPSWLSHAKFCACCYASFVWLSSMFLQSVVIGIRWMRVMTLTSFLRSFGGD